MRSALIGFLLLLVMPTASAAERARIELNGTWEFRLDPNDDGEVQAWHSADADYPRSITVPGAWQAQGVGEPNGVIRHDYAGPAWYRRTIDIPATWRGNSIRLRIGGAHRYTRLYVNGQRIGEHRGFSAPFAFDVTEAVRPGEPNVFALRIENPGAVPREGPRDQKPVHPTGMLNYLGNWGGIYGNVRLEATDPVWIEHVYVRPDVDALLARFVVTVQNRGARAYLGDVHVSVGPRQHARGRLQVEPGKRAEVEVAVPMRGARLWSPEDPHLYTAAVSLQDGGRERDRVDERFGMRQVTTRGNVLLLNGKPLFLRGYGDDNIEVLTGFPPSSREVYVERLRQARAFGFNAMRFHSMTPAEEFFHAADEVGLFVMAELPVAYTQYVLPHRDFLRQELEAVVRTYRNRPSLLSVAFGNEFNLDWLGSDAERKLFLDTVDDFYRLAKSLHPDGVVLSNDGYVMRPTDLVSHFEGALADLPVVKHEFGGYYCSLPDTSLIGRFTGVVSPDWLKVKQQWVEQHGLADQYPRYVRNSQRLQQLGRKFQIERVRRQPGISGYHYWLIVDFPGGTGEGDSWEEGWFDYFWQPKGITPEDGQAINSAVLPLIDAGVDDRTLWNDMPRTISVIVSNFGDRDLVGAPLSWKLVAEGDTVASGTSRIDVPMGTIASVDEVTLQPPPSDAAHKLELVVQVNGAQTNSWSFWSFPRAGLLNRAASPVYSTVKWAGIQRLYPFVQPGHPVTADGLLITPLLDEPALEHLRRGGRVWLMAERGRTRARSEVAFFPASGGALGTMVQEHPALAGFPHEGLADLQFFNLVDGAQPLPLDTWKAGYEPIVGGIRTTTSFLSKSKDLSRVGYVFEARVGQGRLLVTSLRFREHFDEAYPEAIYLFDRLLRYAIGGDFAPAMDAGQEQLQELMPSLR
jgi:beta-galactosidase